MVGATHVVLFAIMTLEFSHLVLPDFANDLANMPLGCEIFKSFFGLFKLKYFIYDYIDLVGAEKAVHVRD